MYQGLFYEVNGLGIAKKWETLYGLPSSAIRNSNPNNTALFRQRATR